MADEKAKLITPVFRVCFPAVFQPESMEEGGPMKYGVSAVWDPSKFSDRDKKRWAAMRKALDTESQGRFKKDVKDLPGNFKRALRDGAERAHLEGYGEGTVFANLTTKSRPGVVDISKSPIGPEHGNADEIYPGCYCRATVGAYSYDNKGKGVALGLNNLQKVKDGPRLDGRTRAEDDFEGDEVDDAWLETEDDPLGGDDDDIPF